MPPTTLLYVALSQLILHPLRLSTGVMDSLAVMPNDTVYWVGGSVDVPNNEDEGVTGAEEAGEVLALVDNDCSCSDCELPVELTERDCSCPTEGSSLLCFRALSWLRADMASYIKCSEVPRGASGNDAAFLI